MYKILQPHVTDVETTHQTQNIMHMIEF